jgi:hypothetical protein
MGAPQRYGWRYSLFAGLVALAISFAWMIYQNDTLGWDSIKIIFVIAATAVIATRLAAWIAWQFGLSDHGALAALLTWPAFSFGLVVTISVTDVVTTSPSLPLWAKSPGAVAISLTTTFVYVLLLGSVITVPACVIGTLIFNGIVHGRPTRRPVTPSEPVPPPHPVSSSEQDRAPPAR